MSQIKKGVYQHYKGPLYFVHDIARHSETEEELVVYKTLYGDFSLWVRPLSMFAEMVNVDGKLIPRFKWISDEPPSE
jgi:hypothetical protein